MTKKYKYGWIHCDKDTGKFWTTVNYGGHVYSNNLQFAVVFKTRNDARHAKYTWDTVLKVLLNENGKPRKIVGRG